MTFRRTGPVRSEEARTAILAATGRLMSERGYEHLTIEGIAQEAGVGKQTIYRWWKSKGEIIADSLLDGLIFNERLTLPDTGNIQIDLVDWLNSMFTILREPSGEGLVRSLIAAAAENASVGRRLRDALTGGPTIVERLRSAVDSGELRADAASTEMIEALVGAVIIRALSRVPVEAHTAERLVRAVLGENLQHDAS